jgi:hypothetical protein
VKVEPDTTMYLRIGPPWKKDGEVWKDSFFHGGFKTKVYCAHNDIDPETGKKRKCKVERRQRQLAERTKYNKKLWTLLNQKSKGLWNALVVEKFKKLPNGKVKVLKYQDSRFKILDLSFTWNNALMDIFSDDDLRGGGAGVLGITHPKYGRLIKLRRTGAEMDTNYTFTPVLHETPISKSPLKRKKLLATLIDLDKVVSGSTDEELSAFIHSMEKQAKKEIREDADDERSHDDDDVDSDVDENDEEEETEEDEDEDEAPQSKKSLRKQYLKLKKKLKSKHKEEEDDDEEDEE